MLESYVATTYKYQPVIEDVRLSFLELSTLVALKLIKWRGGGQVGRVVVSKPMRCGFKYHIQYGHFFKLMCCKKLMVVRK